jgi:hypothetical protein
MISPVLLPALAFFFLRGLRSSSSSSSDSSERAEDRPRGRSSSSSSSWSRCRRAGVALLADFFEVEIDDFFESEDSVSLESA